MWTYSVYLNSLFQALSIYAMTIIYDGWGVLFRSFSPANVFKVEQTTTSGANPEKENQV